jgi:hypothetical protein
MKSVALIIALLLLTSTGNQAQTNAETTNPEARRHWSLGYEAMRANHDGAAAEEYRLATQADPKFAEAYYYQGLLLALQSFTVDKTTKPPASAAESFQMYLALEPAGKLASEARSMLNELGAPVESVEVTSRAKAILAAEPAPAAAAPQPVETPRKAADTPSLAVAAPAPHAISNAGAKPNPTPQPVPANSIPLGKTNSTPAAKPITTAKPAPPAKQSPPNSVHVAAAGADLKNGSAHGSPADGNAKPKPSTALRAAGAGSPAAATNPCLRYRVTHGGVCGTADAVEIRAWNICPQPSAIQVCLEDATGRWNCAISLHSRQRNAYTGVDGAMQFVCHGTGRTRALSLPSAAALPIFPPVSH